MLGHKKIQLSLLLAISVIGCSSKDMKVDTRKPFNGTTVVDAKIANAIDAPMPKILPQTHFAAARLLEAQGEINKAAVQYRKAIAVNHQFVAAYHRLGMLISKQGQHEEAIALFKAAVDLQPGEAILHNNLGFELMFVKQWTESREHFTRALELNPELTRAHINMGLVLSKLGEFDRALESFSAVLPEADAYYNLGLMYRGQKHYDDAARSFEHVLKCNPKFTAAQKQLAELVGYLKSPEEKFASKKMDVKVQPAPELSLAIDRMADHNVDSAEPVEALSKNFDSELKSEVVVITLPTKETQPTPKDTSGEPVREEWENVFDDLAHHFANVGSETIKNTYEEKTSDAHREVKKAEITLAVPMPRVSRITPRRSQRVQTPRKDKDFLQQNPTFQEGTDQEVVAMTGLSLDDSNENPTAAANRPAVIPETLDWFRGKLNMVRNEIACLEREQQLVDEMPKPIYPMKKTRINRSVLVREKTNTNSKSRVKKSKPITDANGLRINTWMELFKTQNVDTPFVEFTGLFKYLFASIETNDHDSLRDQDDMIADVVRDLDRLKDGNPTRLTAKTKSPQDETREWMLKEFGSSAQWLLQPVQDQTSEDELDRPNEATTLRTEDSQEKTPTTIGTIIRSAKSLVMAMATP